MTSQGDDCMSRKPKRISLEQLETRQLLSVGARVQLFPMGTTAPAPVLRSALSTAAPVKLNPLGTSSGPVECIPLDIVVPGSGNANSPVGLTPAQIRKAYGVDSIDLNGVVGDGKGQTVAIVDA